MEANVVLQRQEAGSTCKSWVKDDALLSPLEDRPTNSDTSGRLMARSSVTRGFSVAQNTQLWPLTASHSLEVTS